MTDADAAYPGGTTSSDKRSSGLGVARIVWVATYQPAEALLMQAM